MPNPRTLPDPTTSVNQTVSQTAVSHLQYDDGHFVTRGAMPTPNILILLRLPHLAAPAAHVDNTNLRMLGEDFHVQGYAEITSVHIWTERTFLHVPH
jgi:hypothetical protein